MAKSLPFEPKKPLEEQVCLYGYCICNKTDHCLIEDIDQELFSTPWEWARIVKERAGSCNHQGQQITVSQWKSKHEKIL